MLKYCFNVTSCLYTYTDLTMYCNLSKPLSVIHANSAALRDGKLPFYSQTAILQQSHTQHCTKCLKTFNASNYV